MATYSYAHKKTRAALLPLAYGEHCPMCGDLMMAPGHGWLSRLELDHETPRALGGTDGPVRMVHGRCNEKAGSRLGHLIRWGSGRTRQPRSRW